MPFATFLPFTNVGAGATWVTTPSAFRVLFLDYSVYQIAGHIEMLVLVGANSHPVLLGTDASFKGSPSSRLLLEVGINNLRFSLES